MTGEISENIFDELKSWNEGLQHWSGNSFTIKESESKDQTDCDFSKYSINKKLFISHKGITKLSVHGLILPYHNLKANVTTSAQQIHLDAGPLFANEIRKISDLHTSEVQICNGHDLHARFVILTAEPKYNSSYVAATEHALHSCYRHSLQIASENNLRTLAILPMHIEDPSFPLNIAVHTTLRTIRKCMERLSEKLDGVVLYLGENPVVKNAYMELLPIFFPRTTEESLKSEAYLTDQKCNEWGEVVIEEREIRIQDFSTLNFNVNSNIVDRRASFEDRSTESSEEAEVTKQSMVFSSMSGDHDSRRMQAMMSHEQSRETQTQNRIYNRLLRHARTEDLSAMINYKAIYLNGKDVHGNQVVVIVGRNIPFYSLSKEKMLLYIIQTLDSCVNEPYTVIYFHTLTTDYNYPSMDFLKKLYNTLDNRYKYNLVHFCLVHATVWSRIGGTLVTVHDPCLASMPSWFKSTQPSIHEEEIVSLMALSSPQTLTLCCEEVMTLFQCQGLVCGISTWLFTTFSTSGMRKKVINIPNIPALYSIVPPNQINIPPFVLDFDMKANPTVYQRAKSETVTQTRRISASVIDMPL